MNEKFRASLAHGLMAYLLSLGMTLTALGVTGLLQHGWMAAMLLLVLSGGCVLTGMKRKAGLVAASVAGFAGVIWLLIGGAGAVTEVIRALSLHMTGLKTALPMVGADFTVMVSVLCLAASWFVTQRSAGAYPALILLVMIAALLWLGDMAEVLPCLLPAAVACVTLLLRAGDEQTSTLRVLPLAAAVTVIAFTCAGGGAVAQPLKRLADDIRQRIYDTFFYTQPRDVFTLATEGWYPQGQGQLGGPAEPHDQPVMAVITPRKTYLRGVSKNVYTGRTWLDDIGGRRYLWSASRFEELRAAAFDQNLPRLDASQNASLLTTRMLQVRMLRDGASTMFVPQRLRQLTTEGNLMPYFNNASEVFATSNLQLGDVWTAEAALFTSQDAELPALVQSAYTEDDPRWEEVCDTYLQLHEQIDQRVYDMAAQVTAGITTPYGKAMALQNFLASNFVYDLDVPQQPANQDFVSTFLVETKAGYCTYFASAMTVMCRMAGLPARYVEGFVAYPDAEGMAVVTGQEGHAWTEVYFRGFGWVTFDATPVSVEYVDMPPEQSNGPQEPPQEPESTPEPDDAPQEEPTPTPPPEDAPQQEQPSPSPDAAAGENDADEPQSDEESSQTNWWWLVLLALVALAARVILVQPQVQVKRQQTEFRRWVTWVQAAHDALRSQGIVREPAESLRTFHARAAAAGADRTRMQQLADAENLMFYGHADPYAEETAQAREIFQALYAKLNLRQKAVFQLRRVCLPARLRQNIVR